MQCHATVFAERGLLLALFLYPSRPVHLVVRQIFVKVIVDLHCRRPTASADAFDFFQRKCSVRGGLLVADAQLAFAMVQNLFSAAQHAADIGANLNMIFAHRLGVQQGVVADHVADFQFRQFGLLRQMGNHFIAR